MSASTHGAPGQRLQQDAKREPFPAERGANMLLAKARWFNDAQAAVALTIDDLSYGYLDPTGAGLRPFNDWGYGCRGEGSVFRYFEEHFLARFPEVSYTVFLPFGAHSVLLAASGAASHAGDIFESREFGALLQHIAAGGHEIAYHGHNHGAKSPRVDPRTWVDEDAQYTPEQYCALVGADVARIKTEYGIAVRGGRSPGYRGGPALEAAATSGLFRWWSFDYTPGRCPCAYRRNVFAFPTNVSGEVLGRRPGHARDLVRVFRWERTLARLLEQRAIITVTEHFMQFRPDGRRQTPNVFDDLRSLQRIFAFLRGVDVWHATCTEIARYQEAYDHTRLNVRADGTYELRYEGSWDNPRLALVADTQRIQDVATGAALRGAHKRGRWVFPGVAPGVYRVL